MRKKRKGGMVGSPEYSGNANDAAEESSVSQASTVSPDLKQRRFISQSKDRAGCSSTAVSITGKKAKDPGRE